MRPDLSILVPTYRRPEALARTLHRIESCRRDGQRVELVVIDNADDAETRAVVEALDAIDTRVVVEPQAGKNRALNRALELEDLGDVVVFTDDDVEPDLRWLVEIREACRRAPEHAVFGGRVDVAWPDELPPRWAEGARASEVRALGFSEHQPRPDSGPYPAGKVPFGPNFWIRRTLLAEGHRFDVAIGPHPENRILGDETQFLRKLASLGHLPFHAARAVVQHRVTRAMVTPASVRRRAFDQGRGIPHERGLPMPDLLRRSPGTWKLVRRLAIARDRARAAFARLEPGVAKSLGPQRSLGYNVESLRMAGG